MFLRHVLRIAEVDSSHLIVSGPWPTCDHSLSHSCHCRRESTSTEDLFYAHISGMDALARGLRNAAALKVRGMQSCASGVVLIEDCCARISVCQGPVILLWLL
jgi:hypothetical protein